MRLAAASSAAGLGQLGLGQGLGRIELIVGPMFAGKTTELLRRLRRHELAGRRCLIVKHALDDRFGGDATQGKHVVTHDAAQRGALAVTSAAMRRVDLGALPGVGGSCPCPLSAMLTGVEVVGVDEAQFFEPDDLASFCRSDVAAPPAAVEHTASICGAANDTARPL
jgi:thymidine kinase